MEWAPKQFELITTTTGTWSFVFRYKGSKIYKNHVLSCGCTSAIWSKNTLIVKLELDPLKEHQEERLSNKKIDVHFEDGTVDTLYMKITLRKDGNLYKNQ